MGVYHVMNDNIPNGGRTAKNLKEGQEAMGINWMSWSFLKESIPPAYSYYIAKCFLSASHETKTLLTQPSNEGDLICVKEDLLRKSPNSLTRTSLNANIKRNKLAPSKDEK